MDESSVSAHVSGDRGDVRPVGEDMKLFVYGTLRIADHPVVPLSGWTLWGVPSPQKQRVAFPVALPGESTETIWGQLLDPRDIMQSLDYFDGPPLATIWARLDYYEGANRTPWESPYWRMVTFLPTGEPVWIYAGNPYLWENLRPDALTAQTPALLPWPSGDWTQPPKGWRYAR